MKITTILLLLAGLCTAQQAGDTLTNSIGMSLAFIPAGSFSMGSPYDEEMRQDDERPHAVDIKQGFYMSVAEVTQAQWRTIMGSNRSFHKGDSLPAEKMSWKEAVTFCERLSDMEGKTYRLPTEAEWEYACRAGSRDGLSGALNEAAWFAMNSGGETHPAAQKRANAWGLYDMVGNVSEWCRDNYAADYADTKSAQASRTKVIRGGAYDSFPPACRPAARTSAPAAYKYTQTGFRVVLQLQH